MLDVSDLSFAYNAGHADAVTALDRVSLRVAPGEMVAIIGHNGSGKSTLAKLLCAMFEPTGGRISVDGLAYGPDTVWEVRRRVGMVFQRPDDQIVANTVIDDVAFGPENLGLPRAEIERRVAEVLGLLGLQELAQTPVSELSAGEKQRLAIAGVLAMQPAYLILDEPTTMIAPRHARQLIGPARRPPRRLGMAVAPHHPLHARGRALRPGGGHRRRARADAGSAPRDLRPRRRAARGWPGRPPVTAVAQRLRARGVSLSPAVLTAEELADGLAAFAGPGAGGWGRGSAASRQPPPPAPTAKPLIEARDLRFTYMAGTPMAEQALRGVSCAVVRGRDPGDPRRDAGRQEHPDRVPLRPAPARVWSALLPGPRRGREGVRAGRCARAGRDRLPAARDPALRGDDRQGCLVRAAAQEAGPRE